MVDIAGADQLDELGRRLDVIGNEVGAVEFEEGYRDEPRQALVPVSEGDQASDYFRL